MKNRWIWNFWEGFFVWGSLILCGWLGAQGYTLAAMGLLFFATISSIVLRSWSPTLPGPAAVAELRRAAAPAEAAE